MTQFATWRAPAARTRRPRVTRSQPCTDANTHIFVVILSAATVMASSTPRGTRQAQRTHRRTARDRPQMPTDRFSAPDRTGPAPPRDHWSRVRDALRYVAHRKLAGAKLWALLATDCEVAGGLKRSLTWQMSANPGPRGGFRQDQAEVTFS